MNRGVLGRLAVVATIVLCCVMVLPAAAHAEDQTEFHITNRNDFLACVALSRQRDTSQWRVYLDNDIVLNDDDMNAIVADTVKHLSFGNKEHPFKGVFDGQNHTVKGLNYENKVLDPERDTGFFAETDGATIKNFLVKDANIWADFRGGIIVGRAINTHFENVMVMESTLHVTCANNMLNVITNAGFEGGLIAGELDGCTLYNCEVRGGRAVNNTTSGVQAIGGEGLYMAAFAGYVKNSTIEYCRVTPTRSKDGSSMDMTDVTNKYDVAIGALGGNNVYASGFVGCMAEGAKVIDCFSTAKCYSYAASYVGVVSVTRAWTGGLAGRILSKSGNEITRSHFAGDLSSRQYNPIAVIPIIQNDVNLGGIAARANKGDATVTECYFKPSVSLKGSSQGTAAKKKIPSFGGDGTTKGDSYGPWDDGRYTTRELWEEHDYDFCAGTMRSTDNDNALGGQHANEWAMDYKLNIPVHGQSVKATIDFPGAGTATIEATKLGTDQATTDPYTFAVSAVLAGTAQGLAQGDTSVTFKQDTSAKPAGLSEANGGYRFMGWFREPDVHVNRIGQDNSWFDGKTDAKAADDGKQVQKSGAHDKTSTYTADNAKGAKAFKGNDLFIASYEAQVLFYNVNGETLNREDGKAHNKSTDWYRYGVGLTPAAPVDRGNLSKTATFIGWTTQPSNEEGMNGGYAAITSDALADLKNKGSFYPAGSVITVVGPTDFYPVYSDYVSNIMTVFEGNEQDELGDVTQRVGVGNTHVDVQPGENGTSSYTVQVRDKDNKPLSEDGKLPDGYRFLGWYENKGTEDAPLEVRVSRDPSYTLPADVDLTVRHTYIARFEYRVDYYVRAYTNHEFTDSKLLCSVWNRYRTPFEENVGSTFVRENVVHWGPEHVDHGIKDRYDETCGTRFTANTLVVSPLNAYSHNVKNDTGADTLKNLYADTDFPGAATLSDTWTSASLNVTVKPVNDRYRLNFWTLERDGEYWTYVKNPIESMVRTDKKYYVRAMITTDVNFYNKGDKVMRTATRRYESNLLQAKVNGVDPTFTYYYPHVNTSVKVAEKPEDGEKGSYESPLTLESSPTDAEMAVPGYKFLGWISTAEVQQDSPVWKYIYDVAGDPYVTSDPEKATPYLATPDSKVTQYQDAYPVYAKYDVNYTTNLHRAGFEGTSEVNVPRYDITPNLNVDTDPATATVTPDIETTVYKSGGELYKLNKVEVELPNGEVKELDSADGNSYSYQVKPGGTYTFVAYYSPLAVVYHLNAKDVDGKVAQQGDSLGSLKDGIPLPTYNVGDVDAATNAYNAFVGWTETKPVAGSGYVVWSDGVSMVNKNTVVKAPMELYPVYRASAVKVQSNIDSNLNSPESVRSLSRTDSGDQISLEVKATTEVVGKDGTKYDFVGWSRDYESDNKYTLLTDDEKYPLEGSEPFESVTYTAVYKTAPYKVRYHGVDGSVLFTATVDSGDERATGAGFVHNVDVPKVNESGNPVYDDNGNPKMEQKSVAYDPDAHSKIVALLDEQAAANGDKRELFLEWRYVGADGTAKSWDEFKGEPVKGDMDLYPVTYRVVANDTSGPANSVTMTAQLKWLLDPAAANTVDDSADKAPFKVCFAKPFMGTQLTVTVMRASYGPGTEGVSVAEKPVNGKFVSLYSLGSGDGSFDLANRLESKKTGEGDQGPGKAVFNFAQTHALTIVKKTTDASAMGQTFRFKVTRKNEGSAPETRMVEVKVDKTQQENDETWYVGSVQFAAPAGFYTVEEDTAWEWRYQGELSTPGKAPGKSAELTISSASSAGDAVVTCVNTRAKDKWVDGGSRAKNVWENGTLRRED